MTTTNYTSEEKSLVLGQESATALKVTYHLLDGFDGVDGREVQSWEECDYAKLHTETPEQYTAAQEFIAQHRAEIISKGYGYTFDKEGCTYISVDRRIETEETALQGVCLGTERGEQFIAYAKHLAEGLPTRSQADRAEKADTLELIANMAEQHEHLQRKGETQSLRFAQDVERFLLNGAASWIHYSMTGCGICYNHDLEQRYLTPSRYGKASSDKLLIMQGYSLRQACLNIKRYFRSFTA